MAKKTNLRVFALLTIILPLPMWFFMNSGNTAVNPATQNTSAVAESTSKKQAAEAVASTTTAGPTPTSTKKASEENAELNAIINTADSIQQIGREDIAGNLQIVGPGGKPVGGRVELIEVNETFKTHFSTISRVGSAIYYDSILQAAEVPEANGTMKVSNSGNRAAFVIVFAPGFTPYLDEWRPITSGGERVIELAKAKPIAVTVLTSSGQPIEGAEIWYRWAGIFNQNATAPLLERFRTRFFQEMETTDENGEALLTSTFPEWATELFVRPGESWATEISSAEAGQPIGIRCADAFIVTGTITVHGKVPEQEVRLKASIHEGDQYWMLEGGRSKEQGVYKITGIPTGYPSYQIEAIGEGLANMSQEIFAPKPGSVVNIDFAMEEGAGGSLKLIDPWGQPIQDARVKFTGEGKRSHLYGYTTDASGTIELPVTLAKKESWWVYLRLGGDLYVRLNQPFEAGSAIEITVPNLAHITNIEIPKELLGDATLRTATWIGLSGQSWGTATWNPKDEVNADVNTEKNYLCASGSAELKVELSDGRFLLQPITLAPGFRGPIAFEQSPTTLRFELPASPPALVRISTQDGITVYEQDNLAGAVSTPLLQGQYSMDVFWSESSRLIPIINLQNENVDLGKIEAADSGSVQGVVIDSNGSPVQWANVSLTSINGYCTQTYLAGLDGTFSFLDTPLGQYYVFCDTATTHGSNSSTLIETIIIAADQLHHNITVQLHQSENNRVLLTCNSDWSFNAYANLAATRASTHANVRAQGPTVLAAQTQGGWLGVAQILDGRVRAQAMPVPAGSGEYNIPSAPMRTSNLTFVDEYGEPWRHLLLRIELLNHPFTRRPTLDNAGHLEIMTNSAAPWSLQVCAPSGQIFRFELAALNSEETLIIPHKIAGQQVTVQNEAGDALPWPTLQSTDGLTTFPSDKNGRAIIPTKYTQALVVSAKGYLPCWIENPQVKTITLPQRIDGVQIQTPRGTTRLIWISDSPFESLWETTLELAPGENTAALPPFHPGSFTFTAFAADGTQLATTTAKVDYPGQMLSLDDG